MDVTQSIPRAQPTAQPPVVFGYVSRRQTAPAAFYDDLYVVLPSYSEEHNFGPCRWAAIHGTTKPAQGAEVVVVFDTENRPIVVWWEGVHA
jgi:hypothetical protein